MISCSTVLNLIIATYRQLNASFEPLRAYLREPDYRFAEYVPSLRPFLRPAAHKTVSVGLEPWEPDEQGGLPALALLRSTIARRDESGNPDLGSKGLPKPFTHDLDGWH